ncbi:MAG: tetratricopeptide repeat protein [Steroidobacteraceae bacterium]
MTAFIVACVVMAAVAIALVVRPLVKSGGDSEAKPAKWAAIATAVALPLLAAFVYSKVTTQPWGEQPPAANATANPEIEGMVNQLEERLKREPNDAEGWVMLGRSFVMLGRYPRAVDAYQQAYDLTKGENISALTGLAEALVLTDEASLSGRAGELIERALAKSPREPRALWYGSLAALSSGKLDVARDRMQALLDQNPPDSVRSVLEAQIADINAQLGSGPATAQAAPASTVAVKVSVSIAPAIAAQVKSPLPMFVLARTVGGGAPLAVVRLSSDQLPTSVDLSDANAMIAGRGLSSVPKVTLVARLSKTGSPQAQPGDFYGEAEYVVQPGTGAVSIVIDRVAP